MLPPIELMVAYAYDAAMRGNPLGFFGMVQVLEGASITIATPIANVLREKLSLVNNQLHYLLSHGELDQNHFKFCEKTINRITASDGQSEVMHRFKMFYRLYANMPNELPN
ncbi:MAG: iron-containing redox enzyme family protein [Candidatus Zeuxoniibacter abyssi]|nr:MAG: iron-containing redox enzyme family protein [Candidatus Persebacteraceae bacterium AB1(2)]